MADYNRNRDWNQGSNYYDRESDYDDRGRRDWEDRNEGGYGNYGQDQYSRYGKDYGYGSRYDTEWDYRRERDYGRRGSQYNRDEDRGYRGRIYGGLGDMNRGFGSTRYDRDFTNYAPGGYQNYGGGAGYGGSYWSGGFGGSSYGREYGNPRYSSDYGIYGDQYRTGGYSDRDSDRGWGDYSRKYNRDYEGTYRPYGDQSLNQPNYRDRGWWDKTSDEVASWFGDDDAERRRRMDRMYSHRGKGPRNYQRSDERIKEDINDRLSDDWLIDATDIEVSVQNGEVTLTGTVDDRTTKRRAEDIADGVSGVRNVENRLRVSRESSYSTMGTTTGTTTAGSATTGMGNTEKSKSRVSETART